MPPRCSAVGQGHKKASTSSHTGIFFEALEFWNPNRFYSDSNPDLGQNTFGFGSGINFHIVKIKLKSRKFLLKHTLTGMEGLLSLFLTN